MASSQQVAAPIVRATPPLPQQQGPAGRYGGPYGAGGKIGSEHQHLSEWMNTHRSLTLDQQQRALAAEPGFRELPPAEQQRIHQRLTQLNGMGPTQRERTLARTEAMERLAPAQRQQVRSALSDLGGLPEERRRAVARTFREFRGLPYGQQEAYLNSPQLRGQFSDRERYVLGNLFAAEPYLPPPIAGQR